MMIEARGLTKDYGSTRAVADLTFTVRPGMVTGFLGPNGAGKSTAMRLILGLDAPSAGDVTVNGERSRGIAGPLPEVSALLDAGFGETGASRCRPLGRLAQAPRTLTPGAP